MKKQLVSLIFILSAIVGFAQTTSGYGNIFKRQTIQNARPIPYPSVRNSDVIWAKLIWREVSLPEKMNLPLYFPRTPIDGRYSLIDLLVKGIKEESIMAFDTDDDEFKVPISIDAIQSRLGSRVDTVDIEQADGSMKRVVDTIQANTSEVKRLLIKELWFFDKQSSTMQVRIIGICPVRVYKKKDSDEIMQMKLFWINYDESRNLLAKYEVYNTRNDAMRYSFDALFVKRRFSSVIKGESNVYNNRTISSYAQGVDAMIESDRINNEIFNWEQDLWHY